ncbi:MAG: endonuclease V [Nitrospiria bacterium]
MDHRSLHAWDVSPAEAIQIQRRLRPQLTLDKAPKTVKTIAGVDVSYTRGSNQLYAAIVVFDLTQAAIKKKGRTALVFPVIESVTGSLQVNFPYIPGLLSFREIPVVLTAWEKLTLRPDCIICDGQGLAHPRRMGLASHLGLILDLPSIGCGKSRLIGEDREPGPERGDRVALIDKDEVIGMILRTRKDVAPLYISQGHRMTLDRAVEIVLSCQGRYRQTEAIRMAHRLVNEARQKNGASKDLAEARAS